MFTWKFQRHFQTCWKCQQQFVHKQNDLFETNGFEWIQKVMNAIWFKCFLIIEICVKLFFFLMEIFLHHVNALILLVYIKMKNLLVFPSFYIFNTSRRHVWYFEIVESCKIKSLLFWEFIFPSLKCRQVFILVMKILSKCCCLWIQIYREKHCCKVQCK